MLRFEPDSDGIAVRNEEWTVGRIFKDEEDVFYHGLALAKLTAAELRTIADELDRLNRAGEGK